MTPAHLIARDRIDAAYDKLRARVAELEAERRTAIDREESVRLGLLRELGEHRKRIAELEASIIKERNQLERRILELETALNEIYHSTSSTTHQMELINEVLPQQL